MEGNFGATFEQRWVFGAGMDGEKIENRIRWNINDREAGSRTESVWSESERVLGGAITVKVLDFVGQNAGSEGPAENIPATMGGFGKIGSNPTEQ